MLFLNNFNPLFFVRRIVECVSKCVSNKKFWTTQWNKNAYQSSCFHLGSTNGEQTWRKIVATYDLIVKWYENAIL